MRPHYYITKASRSERHPYQGPSCETAGVPSGFCYLDEGDAKVDARSLASVNRVGWDVRDAAG